MAMTTQSPPEDEMKVEDELEVAGNSAQTRKREAVDKNEDEDDDEPEHNAIAAWAIIPHFQSTDIQQTINYYTQTLGFSLGGTQSDPETNELTFCSLYAGHPAYHANIYFFLFKNDVPANSHTAEQSTTQQVGADNTHSSDDAVDAVDALSGDDGGKKRKKKRKPATFHPSTAMIGLATKQLDEYYLDLIQKGTAFIVDDIADRDYGYRQFNVRDHDGNVLQFFRFLEGGNPSD